MYSNLSKTKTKTMLGGATLCALMMTATAAVAQPTDEVRTWTLGDVLAIAGKSSPSAVAARHSFRSAYWDYRAYRANYLPSLNLTSSPRLERSINQITMQDGTLRYVEQNFLNTNLALSLQQRVALTGGTLSLSTSADRLDMLSDKTWSWNTMPVNITYSQSLFGFNSFKWERRTAPLRYEEAKRSYLETMEFVSETAVRKFYGLLLAQSNYESACQNYAHADTLYQFAQGRYRIGTITENEMLQLGVNRLNEETNRMDAAVALKESMLDLSSFLGMAQGDSLPPLSLDATLPDLTVNEAQALQLAHTGSPDILSMRRAKIEAEAGVARAKAEAGLKADVYMRFGLTQTATQLGDAYRLPLDQQTVSVGISMPILDWGQGRGRVKVAKSQRDLTETQVEQSLVNFDQNVRKLVSQFNLQARRVEIARQTAETALRRSDVARRLYLLGRSNVLDLNASITEKDNARRNYINAVATYWSLYFTLRSITLHDFATNRPIEVDHKQLVDD